MWRRASVSQHSLYQWIKLYGLPERERQETQGQAAEIRRLKAELKRVTEERIRRRVYLDREEARRDVFDYIEMIYNPKRRHGYANGLAPVKFEKQYFNRLECI